MSQTYDPTEVATIAQHRLPKWCVVDECLVRTYRTGGWKASMLLAGAVAHIAELAWHHPEIKIQFNRVELRVTDHEAGGLSDKDFALAEQIEAVVTWQPESPLTGTPDDARYRYVLPEE